MKKLLALMSLLLVTVLSGCQMAGTTGDGTQPGGTQSIIMYIGVMVVFFGAMYFIAIRPEKKRQKEQKAMLDSMRVGDTILTTSGFYGVVIDITDDTVIVEFGNNKACRIPMQRAAIVQVEHPEGSEPPAAPAVEEKKKDKKEKKEEKEDK